MGDIMLSLESLPVELFGLVLVYSDLGPGLLRIRLVSKRWAQMYLDLLPLLPREIALLRTRLTSRKHYLALSNLKCIQVFEVQMRGLYLCQSQVESFRSQDITAMTKDTAVALCGLFMVLGNKPQLPERVELEYLARYTKCPLFGNRLAESSPSQMKEETVGALRMIVEDADFLKVRDGVPGLPSALANWVSMFYSYSETTRTIKKLTTASGLLNDQEAALAQLQASIEKSRLLSPKQRD